MEAVEEAVYKDYERWSKEEGNSGKEVDDFMEEMYGMQIGEGNIFDRIKEMTLPPNSQESTSSSALLQNLATCREQVSTVSQRRKRDSNLRVAGKMNQF